MIASAKGHPCAAALADYWFATDPDVEIVCCACGETFRLARLGGLPSIRCPGCHHQISEEDCAKIVAGCAVAAKNIATAEPAAAAPADKRGDPPGLDDVIGNPAAVMEIRVAMDAHHAKQAAVDGRKVKLAFPHLLLSGVGGIGKTMLAEIIAREIKRPLHLQMGQSMNTPARVADVLLSLKAGDVLFIDELAGLKPQCQETLYRAMEDGILIPIEKSGQPVVPPIRLPAFTLIGSTTDEWSLLSPFMQRFKHRIRLERMTDAELSIALTARAEQRHWAVTQEAADMIAERSHGTPRLAIGLLDGCMDTAIAQGGDVVDADMVSITCKIRRIDRLGLDAVARKYLRCLESAGGDPVRVNVLASKLEGLSRLTLERKIEPDLVFLGLIEKGTNGRTLTPAGRAFIASNPA